MERVESGSLNPSLGSSFRGARDAGTDRGAFSVWNSDGRSAALLLAPLFAVLFAVAVFPIVYSLYTSLFDLNLARPHRQPFVGADNYVRLLSAPKFWSAVLKTAIFTVVTVSLTTLFALGAALLLNETFPGRRLLSALLLVPWATPSVVNGLMWKWIYDPTYGALNGALVAIGALDRYTVWLGDPAKTMWLVANAAIWKQIPLAAILLLVGMKAIPEDLYKAAKVDGANVFQRFWHITVPELKSAIMLVVIYEAMVMMRHFDLFNIMTQGGPADTTSTLSWLIYVETFRNLNFGLGAAAAYLLAMLMFAMAYVFVRAMYSKHERA